jgi:hypothetical protein
MTVFAMFLFGFVLGFLVCVFFVVDMLDRYGLFDENNKIINLNEKGGGAE